MNELLFGNECAALLNINTISTRSNDAPAIDTIKYTKSGRVRGKLTIPSYGIVAILSVLMMTTMAATPVLSEDEQFFDPLADKLEFWGYQRLIHQIGEEKTRQVVGLIEYSAYPEFVRAMITVESAWWNDSRSNMDAIGLMQIRMIAASEVDPFISEDELFEPLTNVEIGIEIFEEHMKYFDVFDETEHWALTSYNRGRGGTFALKQSPPYTDYSLKVLELSEDM